MTEPGTVEIYADTRKADRCVKCHQAVTWGQTTRDKIVGFKGQPDPISARLHTTSGRLILKMALKDVHECQSGA